MTQTGAHRKRSRMRRMKSCRAMTFLGAFLVTAGGSQADTTPPAVVTSLPWNFKPAWLVAQAGNPASRDALFADEPADKPQPKSDWGGFVQGEAARTYRDPDHWSKLR